MYYTLLILLTAYSRGDNQAIVVPGFDTYELCLSSAERVKVQFKAEPDTQRVTTVCVRVKQ